jgi:hypothetical protein
MMKKLGREVLLKIKGGEETGGNHTNIGAPGHLMA